jgi:hypothetical protein
VKQETVSALLQLKRDLESLKKAVKAISTDTVSKIAVRQAAEKIATHWVEDLRSPLEHKFKIDSPVIAAVSEGMKRLHVLSRPNNRKTSYLSTIKKLLDHFDDRLILPIQQSATRVDKILDLEKLIPGLDNPDESDYLREAIDCAANGYRRAAVVMGWCATIDRIQRKFLAVGLEKVNKTSVQLKAQTTGKFKRWNKEFSVSTPSELQTIFDSDLIILLEGMALIDGNEAARLETCFLYRNQSAHPSAAPIADPHVLAFFTDVVSIVLRNERLEI